MAAKSEKPTAAALNDMYVVAKAIMYAIGTIQKLPAKRQEIAEMQAMCDMLYDSFPPDIIALLKHDVEDRTGSDINLPAPSSSHGIH